MLLDILRQFKWLDIVFVILFIRICFVALRNGFSSELFKLLGTLSAIFLSLHYYTYLSDMIQNRTKVNGMPLEFLDFFIFLVLVFLGYFIFVALRIFLSRFIQLEAVPLFNKWGGLALGLLRAFFLVGLVSFGLAVSSTTYLSESVKSSYLGKRSFSIVPNTYKWLWGNVGSKIMSNEKLNTDISEVEKNFEE
ncbi:MAG: CvpA family protein [Candidatus Omnitrophota bacterium]|jgi:uncharacterized membrane protein required for colicin V production